MVLHEEELSGTASSGSLSLETVKFTDGMCRQILVKPATSSTTWDITITNDNSFTIYIRTSCTGSSAEIVNLPLKGVHTITFSNTSVDELFKIKLMIQDQ